MNNTLFGISNPFEYTKKLNREYKRLLIASDSKSKEDQVDHALNFSFAAWHLADRVWHYQDTQHALRQKGIENWGEYLDRIFCLCPGLRICHELSIQYKHHNLHRPAETVRNATQVSKGGISKISGIPVHRIKSILGVPISKVASFNGVAISAKGPNLIITKTDKT